MFFAAILLATLPQTRVVDGDTIIVRGEHIRLLGIDAPEMRGVCRVGRVCVAGNPIQSKNNLIRVFQSGPLHIRRFGFDRYGRTLAMVAAGDQDLSCAQLQGHFAVYVKRWDKIGGVQTTCPNLAF